MCGSDMRCGIGLPVSCNKGLVKGMVFSLVLVHLNKHKVMSRIRVAEDQQSFQYIGVM